ncbi:hypothetical protein [Yoonia litorea]|uniref:Uncharacterized protein n=1 Tax=Yoonia litorea TaxID=1123755 RepID=A0A1I6MGF2_9RHOB|nr:hypothetical protein [Yoonia litorea]SFS14712.1 hypothetical protein SAMN05444714_1741 [Yoonia litorea]
MKNENKIGEAEIEGMAEALAFLTEFGDAEIRRFLCRLPIYAGNVDAPMTLRDLAYEIKLSPYVDAAWTKVRSTPGLTNQIAMVMKVIDVAERELKRDSGETRQFKRNINILAMMNAYQQGGHS